MLTGKLPIELSFKFPLCDPVHLAKLPALDLRFDFSQNLAGNFIPDIKIHKHH
jgi:hypothetical protein